MRQGFIIEGLKSERDSYEVKRQAMKVEGVKQVEFDYDEETGYVTYDEAKTGIDEILSKIEEKGFKGFILDEKEPDEKTENSKSSIITREFTAKGTTCNSCAEIISRQAMKVDGVKKAEFDYVTETGYVIFDKHKTNINEIFKKIEKKGYQCSLEAEPVRGKSSKALGWIFGMLGVVIVAYFVFRMVEGIQLPQITANMGYGLLFLVGILTGFHCIAMCGGFVVSYTAKDAQEGRKSHKSHLMYGFGKTISYTIIGAIFGLVGSIVAFTPTLRAVVGILSGLFLVLFGLKMLNIFPILRKIQFKTPRFISRFVGKESTKKNSTPFIIGLLNGLMIACGPLQAIYILAAGTGSMLEGAKLLFVFALGTLPVMLGFGYFASFISSKMTQKILKASGVIVIILGLMMLNTGLTLSGSGYDARTLITRISSTNAESYTTLSNNVAVQKDGYQEIRMDVKDNGWTPDKFILKKGVPVHWVINGIEVLSCNGGIQVPKYNLKFEIKPGEQTIEFTPTESGVVPWSCWMGMIPGTFIVKDDIDLKDAAAVQQELNTVATPAASAGSTCNMGGASGGGGGCGCGG